MKIYTKSGDNGETSLIGGDRVQKDHVRIEAYGTVDELNAAIGLAISLLPAETEEIGKILQIIQEHLFEIGAELATVPERKITTLKIAEVDSAKVEWLELGIDTCDEELPPLHHFILPGGQAAASALHLARTICRRAERQIIRLDHEQPINPDLICYINRLSDLLFTFARLVNTRAQTTDIEWRH